jgi:alpha-galactosidase
MKITLLGAGSTIFAKNVIGDVMLTPSIKDAHISLYDIDRVRLEDSFKMAQALNKNINGGIAKITAHCGIENRKSALKDADFAVNMVQIGGYEPSTVIDFEIPKKYGLRQTIGDTLGIGGIFRALRTIPVILDFAKDMEEVCPNVWFLNYVNPMAMVTGAILRGSKIKTIGLCHSVQICVKSLFETLGFKYQDRKIESKIAGINHMGWLLELKENGKDLYPELKAQAQIVNNIARLKGASKHNNMIRLEMMLNFGYYVTESSEHSAEYMPYWIKSKYPELIEEFNIPLDEYPRRCISQINQWKKMRKSIVEDQGIKHVKSHEYCTGIINGIVANERYEFGGSVINDNFITNLPRKSIVEIPCIADSSGIHGTQIGDLPEQCAALNRTNINVQLLTLEAYFQRSTDLLYQAAMLDPHTSSELSISDIKKMCDELIEAHGEYMPKLKSSMVKFENSQKTKTHSDKTKILSVITDSKKSNKCENLKQIIAGK